MACASPLQKVYMLLIWEVLYCVYVRVLSTLSINTLKGALNSSPAFTERCKHPLE